MNQSLILGDSFKTSRCPSETDVEVKGWILFRHSFY